MDQKSCLCARRAREWTWGWTWRRACARPTSCNQSQYVTGRSMMWACILHTKLCPQTHSQMKNNLCLFQSKFQVMTIHLPDCDCMCFPGWHHVASNYQGFCVLLCKVTINIITPITNITRIIVIIIVITITVSIIPLCTKNMSTGNFTCVIVCVCMCFSLLLESALFLN